MQFPHNDTIQDALRVLLRVASVLWTFPGRLRLVNERIVGAHGSYIILIFDVVAKEATLYSGLRIVFVCKGPSLGFAKASLEQ